MQFYSRLTKKRKGDPISATEHNLILEQIARGISGVDVIVGPDGIAILAGGGSGTAGTALKLAQITGKMGTEPPWIYSAIEVEHDGGTGFLTTDFAEKSGGDDLGWKLVNILEVGDAGLGVSPLPDGAIVAYWPMGDYYACNGVQYRGTY